MAQIATRVNKPYLPIAVGDLSVQSTWVLVLSFAVVGLLIVGLNFGPFISSLNCLELFLGTIYSVPPFGLKRFLVAAFLIIALNGKADLETLEKKAMEWGEPTVACGQQELAKMIFQSAL